MYSISEEFQAIAGQVMGFHPELEANRCAIAYLKSDKRKTKNKNGIVFADCHKIPEKERMICGYDFIITTYADADKMDDNQKFILMYHELLHVGCDEDGNTYLVDHNLEDFKEIFDKYGVEWNRVEE